MANPNRTGSLFAEPFVSGHAEILSETLRIRPHSRGDRATIEVLYRFQVDSAGWQVPFAFYVPGISSQFQIWLDGKLLELTGYTPAPNQGYLYAYQEAWRKADFYSYEVIAYEYEADLPVGIHEFRVRYVSDAWEDHYETLKENSIRYLLSPAKQWRTIHHFRLEWQGDSLPGFLSVKCNLGGPDSGKVHQFAIWEFDQLPEDLLTFTLKADVNQLWLPARIIASGNFGLGFAAGLVFFGIFWIRSRSRSHRKGIKETGLARLILATGGTFGILVLSFVTGMLVDGMKYLFIPGEWFSRGGYGLHTVIIGWFAFIFGLMFCLMIEWIIGSSTSRESQQSDSGTKPP